MSDKRQGPEVPQGVLRDYASAERVDRIWRRLEQDLPTSSPRQRAALWWAPAAVVIVFGAGVFVGTRWAQPESPVTTTFGPEPTSTTEPASAPESPQAVVAPDSESDPDTRNLRQRKPLRAPIAVPVRPDDEAADHVEVADPSVAAAAEPASTPEWQKLASVGEYEAARKALTALGGFDAALGNASAEQLMLLHDLARIEGQRARAMTALRRVVEQHRGDPNAPLAAYTLGTMLEKDGDRAGAAKYFQTYRELAPKGDLAEDVLVRQVEVAIERGDLARARQLADQYARDFPNGDGLDKHLATLQAGDAGASRVGDDAGVGDDPSAGSADEAEK